MVGDYYQAANGFDDIVWDTDTAIIFHWPKVNMYLVALAILLLIGFGSIVAVQYFKMHQKKSSNLGNKNDYYSLGSVEESKSLLT